jgi:hypothetical protein
MHGMDALVYRLRIRERLVDRVALLAEMLKGKWRPTAADSTAAARPRYLAFSRPVIRMWRLLRTYGIAWIGVAFSWERSKSSARFI